MKNKQTARKMTIDSEKLDEILGMLHTHQQQQKAEIKTLNQKYQEAVDKIASLEEEAIKDVKINRLEEKIANLQKSNKVLKSNMNFYKVSKEDLEWELKELKDDIWLHPDYEDIEEALAEQEKQIEKDNLESENELITKLIEDLKNANIKNKKTFLDTYIVPNYYTPVQIGLKDDEVEGFKEFIKQWACRGEMCEIMKELIENFRDEE